jgi:hypothetical protein
MINIKKLLNSWCECITNDKTIHNMAKNERVINLSRYCVQSANAYFKNQDFKEHDKSFFVMNWENRSFFHNQQLGSYFYRITAYVMPEAYTISHCQNVGSCLSI